MSLHFNPMAIPTVGFAAFLCVGGYWLARRPMNTARRAALYAGALVAAVPALLMVLYYAHYFDSWRWFYEFRATRGSELAAAGIGLSVGMAVFHASRHTRSRLLLWPLFGVLMLLILLAPYAKPLLSPAELSAFSDRWDGRVCRQSTPSSCGAASTATVLRSCGIDVTERELARECYTYSGGTECWYLARAIEKRGLRTRFITKLPVPDPLPVPCVAGIRLGEVGHFIAVLEYRGDTVVTADPLAGERRYAKADLANEMDFTGFFLAVEQP